MSSRRRTPQVDESALTPSASAANHAEFVAATATPRSSSTNGRPQHRSELALPLSHSSVTEYGSESEDEDDDVDDILVGYCSLRMYNTLVLSFGLMFIFTAFNTLQAWVTNLLTSLGYPTLGNVSLTVLYIAVCVALFLTPPLVAYFGQIHSIIIGAACYVLYMASLIRILPSVVLTASAVNGFGASLLWVAVGGLLTKCSTAKDRGRNTGIFWSIFQLSLILGNGIGIAVGSLSSYTTLFVIFTALGALGTSLLFALRRFPSDVRYQTQQRMLLMSAQAEEVLHPPTVPVITRFTDSSISSSSASPSPDPRPTTVALLRSLWRLFTSSSLLLLVPAFLFQGLEFSFWNGEFPLLLPTDKLGLIMLWAGVGEAAGGLTMGTLSDRVGRSLTWLLACVVYLVGVACVYAMRQQLPVAAAVQVGGVSLLAYVAAFTFGLSDAAVNTQIYSILGNQFKPHHTGTNGEEADAESDRRVVAAFTCFNLCQNVAAAVGFFYQPLWHVIGNEGSSGDWQPSDVQLYCQIWLLVAGAVGFVCCDRGWFATREEVEREKWVREEEEEEDEVEVDVRRRVAKRADADSDEQVGIF